MRKAMMGILGCVVVLWGESVWAQSSSIALEGQKEQKKQVEQVKKEGNNVMTADEPTVRNAQPANPELEKVSLIAIETKAPTQFKVHDLVVVIIREQKKYESDSKLETKRDYKVDTEVSKFLQQINGHWGAATFADGKPDIGFNMKNDLKGEGDSSRTDNLTYRMPVEIIDIKPNGLLVMSGKQRIAVDDEVQEMSFTGSCRSEDVTADNTVLSTQVFDKDVVFNHHGAVKDASDRGWLTSMIDWLQPF